jgi:hypothetical protein
MGKLATAASKWDEAIQLIGVLNSSRDSYKLQQLLSLFVDDLL